MQDRVPTPGQEGRVLITPESGDAFYAKIQMADNPTQDGTAFNKKNLLKDATAFLYNLPNTAVPDDVFALIKQTLNSIQSTANSKASIETGSYLGTGQYGSGSPNSLTFSDSPKLIFVFVPGNTNSRDGGMLCLIPGISISTGFFTSRSSLNQTAFTGNSVSWYALTGILSNGTTDAPNAGYQFNKSNISYQYIAFM